MAGVLLLPSHSSHAGEDLSVGEVKAAATAAREARDSRRIAGKDVPGRFGRAEVQLGGLRVRGKGMNGVHGGSPRKERGRLFALRFFINLNVK